MYNYIYIYILFVVQLPPGKNPFAVQSNNNSIKFFNSILYYLCAESTATRPITDTAQRRYNNNNSQTIF
jgi:hypothetical protein